MPRTVQFEGATHQFPDNATDAEVSAALNSMHPATPGMEKLGGTPPPAAAPPLPQALRARGGFPPSPIEGKPMMGGPILPESQIIPSAVGYGVSKLGEHLGLPDWANTAAGIVGGGLAAGGQGIAKRILSASPEAKERVVTASIGLIPGYGKNINAYRTALKPAPPEPFAPVRPNPAIAAKMPFGGPIDTAGGPAYPSVGMSGAPEPPELPAAAKPFKRNPAIARTLGKGKTEDIYNGPSFGPPVRQIGTPVADLPPLKALSTADLPSGPPSYSGPLRVNPGIAKKMPFTPGGAEVGFKGSAGDQPASTLGTRAEMLRQQRLKALYLRNQKMPNAGDQ